MKEIKILGAGLSGLSAAINLAKEGYNVKIFERNNDCGMRFKEDLQGLENWSTQTNILDDLKSMNVEIDFHRQPFYTIYFYNSKLKRIEVTSKKPFFYLVKRGSTGGCLDNALKKQALDLGVKIFFNKRASEKDADIIAIGPKKVHGIVKGISFNTKANNIAIGVLDNSAAPKGYAYLLISEGKGTLSTVSFRDFENIDQYFERTIATLNKITDFNVEAGRKFVAYGNFFLNKNYEKDGKLFTGETAGLQDYWLGFGMRYAITSGYLAAKSIIENKSYDELVKNRFKKQLETSIVNRFIYELGNIWQQLFFRKVKKTNDPLTFLNSQYNSSFMKKLIYPLSKFVLKK